MTFQKFPSTTVKICTTLPQCSFVKYEKSFSLSTQHDTRMDLWQWEDKVKKRLKRGRKKLIYYWKWKEFKAIFISRSISISALFFSSSPAYIIIFRRIILWLMTMFQKIFALSISLRFSPTIVLLLCFFYLPFMCMQNDNSLSCCHTFVSYTFCMHFHLSLLVSYCLCFACHEQNYYSAEIA